MKIYKVLVDELPKTCSNCDYIGGLIFGCKNICELSREIIDVDICNDKPPSSCPLQAAPMWEADYKTSGIVKP